ncbi:hypothetical protein [Meiothermus sp.]|uniref:hypothetical protein n=1 Tax=Meiothermus sp. TaxID=1955249 RepID=UPI0021DEA3C0|nr:hypothetical protein [Meiothermus sp.]GIW24584.1 MAG: hypothetical protein KatS3mg069_0851 [Meiothermus sp.]
MKRLNLGFLVWGSTLLAACAPSAGTPSEASVPIKPGETYVLEVKGLQIAKGNRFTLTVGNKLERRTTLGRDWFFVSARPTAAARGANFNYYPDRQTLSVVVMLDAVVSRNQASRLEVLYCDLKPGQGGWTGSANYDPGLKEKTLKDGTCTLRRT